MARQRKREREREREKLRVCARERDEGGGKDRGRWLRAARGGSATFCERSLVRELFLKDGVFLLLGPHCLAFLK
jgi:hypothetical protein